MFLPFFFLLTCRDSRWSPVTLLAGCLRDVHDVECQLLLFKIDAGNCFLRASSNSRTSAAVAEFLVSFPMTSLASSASPSLGPIGRFQPSLKNFQSPA